MDVYYIRSVLQYTYLGFNVITQDWKQRATNTQNEMILFFMHRHISGVIRTQMILSVPVLISIYGCELYGMSSPRLLPIQRVTDRAIRDILGCSSNYCREAANEELNIYCVVLCGAKLRARVITTWQSSRLPIKGLLDTPYKHTVCWMDDRDQEVAENVYAIEYQGWCPDGRVRCIHRHEYTT